MTNKPVIICPQAASTVPRYLLNELEGKELTAFVNHLNSCNWCKESVRNGKMFIQGIKDIGGENA